MVDNILLYSKLAALPDYLKSAAEDYIDFLATRTNHSNEKPRAIFGSAKGLITLRPDFDEPLEDFNEYMP